MEAWIRPVLTLISDCELGSLVATSPTNGDPSGLLEDVDYGSKVSINARDQGPRQRCWKAVLCIAMLGRSPSWTTSRIDDL
jgi:hypothetical protein